MEYDIGRASQRARPVGSGCGGVCRGAIVDAFSVVLTVLKVYWMMDFSEDYQRKRYKLRRNPYGSSHQMATYFSKGRSGGDSDCEDDFSAVSTASDLTEDKMTVASRYCFMHNV